MISHAKSIEFSLSTGNQNNQNDKLHHYIHPLLFFCQIRSLKKFLMNYSNENV